MTVVAVIVYNRLHNLTEWLRCWEQCDKENAKLVIIHNVDFIEDILTDVTFPSDVNYMPRKNMGYDIAALQDLCRKRIKDFPDYDTLIWCTDDCLPMKRDFIQRMTSKLTKGIGCVAMEISREVRPHIRTTGFCITREVAEKLQFPADPITTKEQCYHFEHRKPSGTFLWQIQKMGLRAVQVSDIMTSPFWDTGQKKRKARQQEHDKVFPKTIIPGNDIQKMIDSSDGFIVPKDISSVKRTGTDYTITLGGAPKIAFICPIYNSHPEIVSSLINQTHKNWVLYLIHDGQNETGLRKYIEAVNDPRIIYQETETRLGNWGHQHRRDWIQKMKGTDVDYIVVTNSDNHHVPVYCERMLQGFTNGQVAVYHSHMVHNYINWGVINCRLERGYLDSAGVMVRADAAIEVGWNNITDHSSDWIYFRDLIKKYGANRFKKVNGTLLVHN